MTTKETDEGRAGRPEEYELYIMRHGIAVVRGVTTMMDDAKRPLTPEGKEKMREIAAGLVRAGIGSGLDSLQPAGTRRGDRRDCRRSV